MAQNEDRRTGPQATPPAIDDVSLPDINVLDTEGVELPEADFVTGNIGKPESAIRLPDEVYTQSPPEYEQSLVRMRNFVAETFGEDAAEAVARPVDQIDALPAGVDLNEIYSAVEPLMAEDAAAMQAGEQFRQEWVAAGGNPAEVDNTMLRQMAQFFGQSAAGTVGETAAGIAEARSWWSRLKSDVVSFGVSIFSPEDLDVGLMTLDSFLLGQKKFKLAFVRKE